MNSKLLIKQNRELFDKLQVATLNNRRLTEENKKLREKIEFLTNSLSNQLENSNGVENNTETITSNEIIEEQTRFEQSISLPPDIEYGSKIIGEIVMSATYYSNILTTDKKDNLKEFINLILGRTEVAKASILNIISSDTSFECKTQMIDTEKEEAIEYFKSILEQ